MTTSFIHLLIYLHYHRRSSKPQYNQLAPPGGWCSLDPCAMADDPEFFRLKLNIAPLKKRLIVETFVCMCMCQNVHNIKLTVLTISVQFYGINYMHTVVQPSPLSICRAFSSSPTETLYPLSSNSPLPPCPRSWQPLLYFLPL